MIQKIKELLKLWSTEGMHFPFQYDPENKGPSVTLMMFYFSSILVFLITLAGSVKMLIKGDLLSASINPIMIWTMSYVFYRMRKLDKFKIDLDDKTIELDNTTEKESGETKE